MSESEKPLPIPIPPAPLYVVGVDAWEVGYAFEGCVLDPATRVRQREIIQRFLDELGAATWVWWIPPEIRPQHANHEVETVGLVDFGRHWALAQGCCWAIYGVMKGNEPPKSFYVEEGTRLPFAEKTRSE